MRNAVSAGVLPFSLCVQLTESRGWPVRSVEYHDGTTERMSLVATSRKSWRMAKRLEPADLAALRSFLEAHPVDAFYIYSLPESGYVWDATGVSTAGRYLVRVASEGWEQTTYIPRADCPLELVEVA